MTRETPIRFVEAAGSARPDYFIANRGREARVLVAIHGISRNAAEIAARFAADSRFDHFTICAPLFERRRFGRYQQLLATGSQQSADSALLALLDDLRDTADAAGSEVCLFGFSGGAQMAHRFAMLHPDRVAKAFVMAAGWYLLPDPALTYPFGLAGDTRFATLSDRSFGVPMTVAVGSRDTRIDPSVRQCASINRTQGKSRRARARNWVRIMNEGASARGMEPPARFHLVANGSHDFGQCVLEAGLLDRIATDFCNAPALC